ncbi:MAG: hypothetical protein M5R42_00960 [Rhodocyclaceae bacterium]|nr:hypothetical protein [Rhodocyclaceae bacterium]
MGLADRSQLSQGCFPGRHPHPFPFRRRLNGCKAAGAGTRMAGEIIQKDLSHEDERYNPITDKSKNIDKGAEGLDCVTR